MSFEPSAFNLSFPPRISSSAKTKILNSLNFMRCSSLATEFVLLPGAAKFKLLALWQKQLAL